MQLCCLQWFFDRNNGKLLTKGFNLFGSANGGAIKGKRRYIFFARDNFLHSLIPPNGEKFELAFHPFFKASVIQRETLGLRRNRRGKKVWDNPNFSPRRPAARRVLLFVHAVANREGTRRRTHTHKMIGSEIRRSSSSFEHFRHFAARGFRETAPRRGFRVFFSRQYDRRLKALALVRVSFVFVFTVQVLWAAVARKVDPER